MFQHFSFSNKTNAPSRPATVVATTLEDENITEARSTITPTNFITVNTSAGTTTPETETMIIGHKLSYEHETLNELNAPITDTLNTIPHTTYNDTNADNKKIHEDYDDDDDNDEDSLLSVNLDDLSGSILDNLPSTSHDNKHNVDSRTDDENSDGKGEIYVDPAFFFAPIVQAMQEVHNEQNQNVVIVPLDDDDDADDEILLLAPSLQHSPKEPKDISKIAADTTRDIPTSKMKANTITTIDFVLTQKEQLQGVMKHVTLVRSLICVMVFVMTYVSLKWISPYWFENQEEIMTVSLSTISDNVYNFTTTLPKQDDLIPVPSPTWSNTDEVVKDNSQNNVPTFMHLAHSIEPTIVKFVTDDLNDGGSKVATTSSPLKVTVDKMSWSETIVSPSVSVSNLPLLWLPHPMIDFISTIRYLPTFIHRIVSWIIYTATIIVTGCVFALLLAKFAFMTWNKANLPAETATKANEAMHSTKRYDCRKSTTKIFTNVESLCEFIQSTQFSRTGRRSRSPVIKAKNDSYNKSCYELLSVDDLKCIGKFLQVPKLSKLQQKSNLINAIVAQYEISLQSLSTSEIKVILSTMKINDIETTNKKGLIKLAIEVGF